MRFRCAFDGLTVSFVGGHSIWIHVLASLLVVTLSFIKGVTQTEIILLTLTIGSVWSAEIFNTAIEKLSDKVSPDYNLQIKVIKDLSAAAVLIASIASLITGLIIFIPKFR